MTIWTSDLRMLSFISFLHQTTTTLIRYPAVVDCLLSLFYIKPQLPSFQCNTLFNCLLSLFYIKPQRSRPRDRGQAIVFYLFSTSNHNCVAVGKCRVPIVFYLFSTSNHNISAIVKYFILLSFISFLHQTTTVLLLRLFLMDCLLSLFYIKPQRIGATSRARHIVFYLFSTSNHNSPSAPEWFA